MFISICRTHTQNKQYFLENLSIVIDHFLSICNNHTNLGDFPANICLDEDVWKTC